jgi:hypothetical protein
VRVVKEIPVLASGTSESACRTVYFEVLCAGQNKRQRADQSRPLHLASSQDGRLYRRRNSPSHECGGNNFQLHHPEQIAPTSR